MYQASADVVLGTNIVREKPGLPLAKCRSANDRFSLTMTED